MEKEEIKNMEDTCLAPFKRAQKLLVEAENKMLELGWCNPGEKSEIRLRFEKFEEDVDKAWKKAFEEYKVDHVFKLPLPVYRQICDKWIEQAGGELLRWLSGQAAGRAHGLNAKENPYVMAGAALGLSYNLAPDPDEGKRVIRIGEDGRT